MDMIVKNTKAHGVHVRSVDIWKGLGYSEHRVIKNLINTNKLDFEEFGVLHEENAKPKTGTKGGRPEKAFLLNEQQFTLLITLVGNTEESKTYKKRLVKEFFRMREQLQELGQYAKVRSDGKAYLLRSIDPQQLDRRIGHRSMIVITGTMGNLVVVENNKYIRHNVTSTNNIGY